METSFEVRVDPLKTASFAFPVPPTVRYIYLFGKGLSGSYRDVPEYETPEGDAYLPLIYLARLKLGNEPIVRPFDSQLPGVMFEPRAQAARVLSGKGSPMKSDEILSGEITSVGSEPLMVKIVVRQDAYTIKVPKAGPLDPAVPTRPRREGPMRDYMAGAQAVIQIGPGGTAEVKSAHAKVAFRPERLTIPSSIGASCEILDFRTEGRSILKGTLERPVPAILFSEQAEAPIVDFGPVGPGGVVSMIVRNVGKQEVGVAFALMGPVVEEGQHEDVSDRATD